MTNPLNYRGGRQFPQSILDDIDARLNALESKPAQSGEQDERAEVSPIVAPYAECSFRICDLPGQCRSEGECHHPRAASTQATATQPVQTERALTDEQWYDLAQRHANADWNSDGYLSAIKAVCSDFMLTAAQPASSLAEGGERE